MNADKLDRLFSDYFHAEMSKRPWPPAPVQSTVAPRTATPDPNRHARRVLAASVALLLGSCWALSNGLTPADRGPSNAPTGTNMLPGATADEKGVLPEIRKSKAKDAPPPPAGLGPINLP
jgi:hypothetical protein